MAKERKKRKKRKRERLLPKVCRFCKDRAEKIDYKDISKIRRSISGRGKILPRSTTGTCLKHQRALSRAIKRARFMGLLPYIVR
ncbi:MAG: 30S ribosomal protein S18 [Candidatus Omnitrophica bacterium]|nr:30S ribosomal protein S18 [Candidatus Omnitrophota bacterium]